MTTIEQKSIIRQLDNGLILRRSTPADAEKIFQFNSVIHGEDGPDERVGQWARDLLELPHPTFKANDYTIVEEAASGRIVSTLNLISQTWCYDGIAFGVGRPELVGTLPEYRRQGLVRIQFEEIHRWSLERGQLAQAITGIPNYYRQFDYEMCVELDGSRAGGRSNLPVLAEGAPEPFRLRLASENDIPFLQEVDRYASRRSLLHPVRDAALWKLELTGRSAKNVNRLVWNIIERCADGEAIGVLAHPWFAWRDSVPAVFYELKAGVSWLEVSPGIARWLWQLGVTTCEREGKTCETFKFVLGSSHPVYEVLRKNLPEIREPYSWYMRVPDLKAFLQRIAPRLEARLENSLIPGYSGELNLNFYKHGLRMVFEKGRIAHMDDWRPDSNHEGEASFPAQTFLQVLFGHRSLEELGKSFTDCFWKNDEARVLLNTLFPRMSSQFIGIA